MPAMGTLEGRFWVSVPFLASPCNRIIAWSEWNYKLLKFHSFEKNFPPSIIWRQEIKKLGKGDCPLFTRLAPLQKVSEHVK